MMQKKTNIVVPAGHCSWNNLILLELSKMNAYLATLILTPCNIGLLPSKTYLYCKYVS